MVHYSEKLKPWRVQNESPINANSFNRSTRRRAPQKCSTPSRCLKIKLIFFVCQLTALSPALSQHHSLRINGVNDEPESNPTFDINSQKPQIRHLINSRAGSILARSVPLAPSECDNDKTVVKRRLVAFDLDPIFPPYDNVFEELFIILENDEAEEDRIEVNIDQAQRGDEGISAGASKILVDKRKVDSKDVEEEKDRVILVDTEHKHVLDNALSDLHDAAVDSANIQDEQTDAANNEAGDADQIETNADDTNINIGSPVSGKSQSFPVALDEYALGGIEEVEADINVQEVDVLISDLPPYADQIETNADDKNIGSPVSSQSQSFSVASDDHTLGRIEEVETDINIQETDVLVSDLPPSLAVLPDKDTVSDPSKSRDEIDDTELDSEGGNYKVTRLENSLEEISSDKTPESEGDSDLRKHTEENNQTSASSTESEVFDESQDIDRNPALVDDATSEDFEESHNSDSQQDTIGGTVHTVKDFETKLMADESKKVLPDDNGAQYMAADNVDQIPVLSTNVENRNESERNHTLVQEDEVDDQTLVNIGSTSTDTIIQKDDEIDTKHELFINDQVTINLESINVDDAISYTDGTDLFEQTIFNDQISVSVKSNIRDETLTLKDHDNDPVDETIAKIPVSMESVNSDETLTLKDDVVNVVEEKSTHDQISDSVDETIAKIPVSMESVNSDEILTLKDDVVNVVEDERTHDQISVIVESVITGKTLVQEDENITTAVEAIMEDQISAIMESINTDETSAVIFEESLETNAGDSFPSLHIIESIKDNDVRVEAEVQDEIKDQDHSYEETKGIEGQDEPVFISDVVTPKDIPITLQPAGNQTSEIEDTFHNDTDNSATQEFDSSSKLSANEKFVQGLDDLSSFMEEVEPPDELDVGAGKSIQEVLVDGGTQIIKTRVQKGVSQVKESVSQFKIKTRKGWDDLKSEGKKNEDNLKKYAGDNNRVQFALVVIEKQKKHLQNINKVIWSACVKLLSKVKGYLKDLDVIESDDDTDDLDEDFLTYRKVTIGDKELAEIRRKAIEKGTENRGGIDSDVSTIHDNTENGNGSFGRHHISDEVQEKVRKKYQSDNLKSSQIDNSVGDDSEI